MYGGNCASGAGPSSAPDRDQLRGRHFEFLGRLHNRGAFADRFNGAKQLGRRGARQIDVPLHRVCGHNTWSLRHAIPAVQPSRVAQYGIFPDREID